MPEKVVLTTDLKDLTLFRRGKVRDVYDLGDKLLIISTDRISCFDVVLACGIPYKGKVLTKLSCFWFDLLKEIIPNHFISADIKDYPQQLQKYAECLEGRSMLVKKTSPLPVECVVRGYLSGSGLKEYLKSGSVCGIKLPGGLIESAELPEVIFTPSTKEEKGHDQNVSQDYVEKKIGNEKTGILKEKSIAIYKKARDYARARGVIIADTKFEFGIFEDKVILIDEVLTPDSSRFWPKDEYSPGKPQPSFDKQFVRDYLESLDWDKTPPAPGLPEEIVEKTSKKYLQAYKNLTGEEFK
ncbi:MAG: phosphoribosylaminoimidazolesuccinocarboxamide synthase [Candidatus Omnitrophica bacterium]|jgi:phosphoribosylaminoimidazole-succinocarboxamide synthase|nr:phosphoribosylaminoimidazolesuccinocarboxamide synthase [Candidatus Omnitrophota bacterium]MDD5080099.1 phosphoribosylaminoimidazolesuccinocarboxamide synthase [Candidatus Omnitrophota bacterium]